MVERGNEHLALQEQADLLGMSRTSLYRCPPGKDTPCPPSAQEVAIKHRIDAVYTKYSFYGSRRILRTLQEGDLVIGRNPVWAYMQEMGLYAIYPKSNLSQRAPGPRIYPYLLRGVKSTYANHIWGSDIPYICCKGGWMYLVAILD